MAQSGKDSVVLGGTVKHSDVLRLEAEVLAHPNLKLLLAADYTASDPLTRAALFQILATRSRVDEELLVEIGGAVNDDDLRERLTSDPLSYAAALYASSLSVAGREVTATFLRERAGIAARHAAIHPWTEFDAPGASRTMVASFDRGGAKGSPDVGSRTFDGWSTDFGARSLFTPIDLERVLDDERESILDLIGTSDHVVVRSVIKRVKLARKSWPNGHPLHSPWLPFEPLGTRIFQAGETDLSRWRVGHAVDSQPGDWLGHALYELIQNAERHGGRAVDGAPIPIPTTMLLVDRFDRSDLDLSACAPSLRAYLAGGESRQYLSVTVLDAGDGLAATAAWRALGRPPLDQREEAAYLRTAVAGQLRERSGPLHGFGLPLVQHLVSDLGGYVRVRSGGSVLHRNFHDHPYSLTRDTSLHWGHDLEDEIDGYLRKGCSFSVIVPVEGVA